MQGNSQARRTEVWIETFYPSLILAVVMRIGRGSIVRFLGSRRCRGLLRRWNKLRDVRLWPLEDILIAVHPVRFRGVPFCSANVCF
jgi:hypothetical protein